MTQDELNDRIDAAMSGMSFADMRLFTSAAHAYSIQCVADGVFDSAGQNIADRPLVTIGHPDGEYATEVRG